jgi:hypothetical protein
MAEPHVVSALREKRARVAGELRDAQMRVICLKIDLGHIDACLRMFKADYTPEDVTPKVTLKKNPAILPKGSGSRVALEILRESGEALSCPEIARRILLRLGKEVTRPAVAMLAKTVHSSFARQRHPVVKFERETYPGKWQLLSTGP